MTEHDRPSNRYGDNDSRPSFLNSEHYLQTHLICIDYAATLGVPPSQSLDGLPEGARPLPLSKIRIDEQDRLLPVEGYFAFYCDLLGFTMEVSRGGMDSLPDYYGGTLCAAIQSPQVKVYLLSDSCIALASVNDTAAFVHFVVTATAAWMSNGLLPQCSVGYGSFVERDSHAGSRPPNFFGTQIVGTALIDAVEVMKRDRSFGSRILLSASAERRWPRDQRLLTVGSGHAREFLPGKPASHCLFECVYYLLCSREHQPGSAAFEHYVWSAASRVKTADTDIRQIACTLVAPHCDVSHYQEATRRLDEVLSAYA